MNPVLSVIIPCYNGEKYLADAVNSVLKQPCQDLEIIIVDDGSRDASGAIADRFAQAHKNIRVFHIPNSGVSVARNVGIDQAAGRYIGFLDADDVLCRDAYDQEIYHALQSEQYDIFSFSHMKGMDDLCYGRMILANAPGVYLREDAEYNQQTEKHFCSYLYRKTLFSDTVRFPEGIRYHEDVCFLFLITRHAKHIVQYEKPWFVYRMNFSSVMHSLKNADFILEEIAAWEWCRQRCEQQKDILDCEGNIFSYMVEYIRFSAMHGVSPEEIREKIQTNEPFQKAMKQYGAFWLNPETAQLYSDFLSTPQKIWWKYRARGLGQTAARWFIRTGPGNKLNQKLRYRLALKDYLVP